MNRWTPAVFCLLLALSALAAAAAAAAESDWYFQHPDSFPRLPTNKLFYLEQKYGLCPSQRQRDLPESLNVRMVGKWGGGPSWAVTGRDTLVYLSRGSEVVVVNFADTANPRILNYIQAKRLAGRPVLSDNLLYLVTSGYIEVFNVADPRNAPRVGRLSVPVADIDVQDSLVYLIGADSFMVYNFADPANPVRLGVCRDSGYALDVDRGYAYLRDRWGMYILDATDPASPHRVASWGTDIAGVKVRGNHCYVAQGQMGSGSLHVLNVSDPANPWEGGRLSGLTGEDIYLVDTLLFLPGFDVVNVADSSRPTLVSSLIAGGNGIWAAPRFDVAVTADNDHGMHVLNISDIEHPSLDTSLLATYSAVDIAVRGGIACVATYSTGVLLLDVSDPASLREAGRYDSAEASRAEAVAVTDSLLYMGGFLLAPPIPREVIHVVDIRNPAAPLKVGRGTGSNPAKALVLRDSLLYVAEDYKFEVFSVADPRQPVWRGSCNAAYAASGIDIQDTLAFVMPDFQVFSVARPTQPVRVSTRSCNAWDIAVRDTIGYVALAYESLQVYSIADPRLPRRLSAHWVPGQARAVKLHGRHLHLGCDDFRIYDVFEPSSPSLVGQYAMPYKTMALDSDSEYIYAACYLAGVCILQSLNSGVAEPDTSHLTQCPMLQVVPNPVARRARLRFSSWQGVGRIRVTDAAGRDVRGVQMSADGNGDLTIDLSQLRAGVYFVSVRYDGTTLLTKVVRE